MVYRIGIDVGGTNTDAAVLGNGNAVIGYAKAPTSPDVLSGIKEAILRVLAGTKIGDFKNRRAWPGQRCSPQIPCCLPRTNQLYVNGMELKERL